MVKRNDESTVDRRKQVFDGLLTRIHVGHGFGPGLPEARVSQLQECLAVTAQRLRTERVERVAERHFGSLPGLQLLGMRDARAVQLAL